MQIKSLRLPRSRYLERGAAELSREGQKRLQWFDYYQAHGRNATLTCRYFGISRQTFYLWKPLLTLPAQLGRAPLQVPGAGESQALYLHGNTLTQSVTNHSERAQA
jgi:hypothetical protein